MLQKDFGAVASSTGEACDVTVSSSTDAIRIFSPNRGSELSSVLFDDMLWSSLPNAGWTAGATGTGATPASSTFGVDATEKAQGVMSFPTGSTATGRSAIFQTLNGILLGQGTAFVMEARMAVSTLSTALEEYVAHFGLIDNANASAEPTDSVCFAYRRATNGDFWVCQCRNNGTETVEVTSIAPGSTFRTFRVEVAANGSSAVFQIDGATVATITTNIPTGAGRLTGIGIRNYKTAGTTSRILYCDWFRLSMSAASAR